MSKDKIPQTDSIEELARFWDTHDVTDYLDEMEEVTEPLFERRGEQELRLRLTADELNALERIAQTRAVSTEGLVHQWVAEKLGAA